MNKILLLAALLIAGPVFANDDGSTHNLAEHKKISSTLREHLKPALAEVLLATQYDAFYEIKGKAKRGNQFTFNKLKKKNSFPDGRWSKLALDAAERVNYEGGSNTVGSRRKPTATAYVVLYEGGIDGVRMEGSGDSLALVLIDQDNVMDPNMPTVKGRSASRLYLLDVGMMPTEARRD